MISKQMTGARERIGDPSGLEADARPLGPEARRGRAPRAALRQAAVVPAHVIASAGLCMRLLAPVLVLALATLASGCWLVVGVDDKVLVTDAGAAALPLPDAAIPDAAPDAAPDAEPDGPLVCAEGLVTCDASAPCGARLVDD